MSLSNAFWWLVLAAVGPTLPRVIVSPSVSWWCYCKAPKKLYLMISLLIPKLYRPSVIHKHLLNGSCVGKQRMVDWYSHALN